jgi:predicted DsbA family dithiol-disulfide isomerase
MSTIVATVALSANNAKIEVNEKKLLKYVKRNIVKNPQVKVKGITIIESKTHKDLPGWNILLTTMDLVYKKKDIHAPETMFIKDGLITGHLINLKTGKDYRNEIKPNVPKSMYNDAHLLFGNKDAEHKVLIFSDPQCPFCQEVVPEILQAAQKNPKKLAVYYYHLPLLRIHPVSGVLTRVMHVAQNEGKVDVLEKIYALKINPRETNATKILEAVKSQTGYVVTKKQIDAKEVKEALTIDEEKAGKMMVSGTPTIYLDGEWDKMRDGYKKFIK